MEPRSDLYLFRCGALRQHNRSVGPSRLLSHSAPVDTPEASRTRSSLVAATANVRHAATDGQLRRFEPFVFSHDRCGIPGITGASFTTEKLELGRANGEPLMTLMTAVACTGAAASPAMGHFGGKFPASRTIMMLLNARLGTWLPNPLSASIREYVESRQEPWRLAFRFQGIGQGFDASVPELLGLHREDAASVYISDGGHYDNLGLTSLLRARCSEIWCIDSEADVDGQANQLREVVALAQDLGVNIDLDADAFAASNGIMGTNFAVANITYPAGPDDQGPHPTGKLIVIKLGLTNSPEYAGLRGYRTDSDPKFPAHSTFRYVAFTPTRIDAYRELGALAARNAVSAYQSTSSV